MPLPLPATVGECPTAGAIWPFFTIPLRRLQDDPITQWEDLLRPEWSRRLVLPDHPRVVIGLGLKAVGASANVEDPTQVPDW